MSKVNLSKTKQPQPQPPPAGALLINDPDPDFGPVAAEPCPPKALVPVVTNNFMQDYIPSFGELRLPRINIVQNIGALKDSFNPGEIVYKQSAILHAPARREVKGTGHFCASILCLLPRRWVEKVEGGARGEIAYSLAEVKELGGTTIWKTWDLKKGDGMRYFQPYAEFVCLVEKPAHLANDEINFPFEVEGDDKSYALAIWGMKSSSFNNCAKTLFTDRVSGPTLKGYPTVVYAVTSKLLVFDTQKQAFVPEFTAIKKTSPAFQEFAHNLRVGTAAAEEAGESEE